VRKSLKGVSDKREQYGDFCIVCDGPVSTSYQSNAVLKVCFSQIPFGSIHLAICSWLNMFYRFSYPVTDYKKSYTWGMSWQCFVFLQDLIKCCVRVWNICLNFFTRN